MPFEFFRVFSFNSLHSVDDFSISNENFVNGLLATSFNAIAIHSVHARALHKHSCKHPAVSLRKHYHFHVMEKFVVWPFFSFICSGCFFFLLSHLMQLHISYALCSAASLACNFAIRTISLALVRFRIAQKIILLVPYNSNPIWNLLWLPNFTLNVNENLSNNEYVWGRCLREGERKCLCIYKRISLFTLLFSFKVFNFS